jgi:hypothetical protein
MQAEAEAASRYIGASEYHETSLVTENAAGLVRQVCVCDREREREREREEAGGEYGGCLCLWVCLYESMFIRVHSVVFSYMHTHKHK